jgi:hypothetical protein
MSVGVSGDVPFQVIQGDPFDCLDIRLGDAHPILYQ